MAMTSKPEFIIDADGNKTKVVLPIKLYEELLEDLHDLRLAAERRSEESVPWQDVEAELEREGL